MMLKDEDILLIQHAQTDMQLTILFMPAISTGMANEVQPPFKILKTLRANMQYIRLWLVRF